MLVSIITITLHILGLSTLSSARVVEGNIVRSRTTQRCQRAIIPAGGTSLPPVLEISVTDPATGHLLGTLTGTGNFSSPGPSYPFHSVSQSDGFNQIGAQANGFFCYVTAESFLICDNSGNSAEFYEIGGLIALSGSTGTSFSVAARTGAAGGNNRFGLPFGIPVFVGNLTAIPVTLSAVRAQG